MARLAQVTQPHVTAGTLGRRVCVADQSSITLIPVTDQPGNKCGFARCVLAKGTRPPTLVAQQRKKCTVASANPLGRVEAAHRAGTHPWRTLKTILANLLLIVRVCIARHLKQVRLVPTLGACAVARRFAALTVTTRSHGYTVNSPDRAATGLCLANNDDRSEWGPFIVGTTMKNVLIFGL